MGEGARMGHRVGSGMDAEGGRAGGLVTPLGLSGSI